MHTLCTAIQIDEKHSTPHEFDASKSQTETTAVHCMQENLSNQEQPRCPLQKTPPDTAIDVYGTGICQC